MGTSFGRGGATTFQQDLQNSDCIVIQGSNMAECHPVGFRWVMEAKARGATIIHVDPRFTRTSAVADVHVPIRAGSDIAFLGGIVRYILENEREFREYVVHYTNASAIVSDQFKDTEDLDGLFSGWSEEGRSYATDTWKTVPGRSDPSLTDPQCVFQILKRHFSRYTPEIVEDVCGVPKRLFLRVAEELCRNSGRERTSAFCYAVGWTQHTVGAQYIRTAAIIQLLLGNIGRPGGGIMALRGHASIQGSTDIPTLYNLLPGYLPMPKAGADVSLQRYLENNTAKTGWCHEFPKYAVSLLKSYFGDAATEANDFGFDYLPTITGDHSHLTTVTDMVDGKVKGYFVIGENPTVGSMNGPLQRDGMRKLDWLVIRDFALIETAEFWREGVDPAQVATEVFFFPAATHTEKDGTFTNTQRLLQWHHKAVEPQGDCRSELHFMVHLGRRLKARYAASTLTRDRPIQAVTWNYATSGQMQEPSAAEVLLEINGSVDRPTDLKADGSTACGCWIYCGSFAGGVNQAARRTPQEGQTWVAPDWGWAWPNNRRILYNRASADPEGKPWSERKKYVWWNPEKGLWEGLDVPDFIADRAPDYRPAEGAVGIDAISGIDPFIMNVGGKGRLFTPEGLVDGPLPTHYEPAESPMANPLYAQQSNPARMEWRRRDNPGHRPFNDPAYPFVITTYRLTEHHTAGGMSRWIGWLAELQPAMFCEVSPELAADRGLKNGGWATISTARAEIEARVLVTNRIAPLRLKGRIIHQIGLPYHWGSKGLVRGDSANDLISFVADPNVSIQESKALTGNIVAGRRKR